MRCDYHPQREAIDKCQQCNKLICLEDKQHINFGSSWSSSIRIACPGCYYELAKKSSVSPFSLRYAVLISAIIVIFFGGMLLGFNLFLGSDTAGFITIFFSIFIIIAILIIFLVYFIVGSMNNSDIDVKQALELYEKHQNSLDAPTQYCMNCGHQITGQDQYCQGCGEPLHPAK